MPAGNNPVTFGGWINTSATAACDIMSYGSSTTYRSLGLTSGALYLLYYGTGYGTASSFYIPGGNWHHVVVTYDGSNARTYTDGVLSGYGTRTTTAMATVLASGTLGCLVGGTLPFTGKAKDMRIYNRVLTQAEVLTWYSQGG